MHHIDPTIANTVSQLDGIVRKKRKLEEDPKLAPGERQERIKNLTMDGCPVEDLGLDFTLPGYPNIELRKGGNGQTHFDKYLITLFRPIILSVYAKPQYST